MQVRDVLCQRTLKDGSLVTEKEGECNKETKPPTEQKCNVHNPCPGDGGLHFFLKFIDVIFRQEYFVVFLLKWSRSSYFAKS